MSKATCLTREDAMTASRCMCLSWCLRSTCDDFFQAKEISIKGRLVKVRLESLGTAIFQRSRYTLAAHNWSMPSTNCSSIQEESTLDQHSPVHEIFNYLTATFPVHHYPEPTRTLPHASIPWNQSAKSWPEAVNLHLKIVRAKCFIHWSRGVFFFTEGTTSTYWRSEVCCWGFSKNGWGNFCHQDSLALRLLCTSLCQVQSISRLDMRLNHPTWLI